MGACVSREQVAGSAAAAGPAAPHCGSGGGKAQPSTNIASSSAAIEVPLIVAAEAPPADSREQSTSRFYVHRTAAAVAREADREGGREGGISAACIMPPDEPERLAELRSLNIIGQPSQPRFEVITALMQSMFNTPMAAVALIDENVHLLAAQGGVTTSGERAGSFCEWALASDAPTLVIVENALEDARFKDCPFVVGAPHIRFYAGAPLISTTGHRYGTLCVFDYQPRHFASGQYAMLAHFSEITVREMEREAVLALKQQRSLAHSRLLRAVDCFQEGIVLLDLSTPRWLILYANDAFRAAAGMPSLLLDTGGAPTASAGGIEAAAATEAEGSGEGGGGTDSCLGFWDVFEQEGSGGNSQEAQDALAGLAAGREFVLRVRPCLRGGSSDCSSSSSSGSSAGGSCQQGTGAALLCMRFKPADTHQLRAAMPHIGIPAEVDTAPISACSSARDIGLSASGNLGSCGSRAGSSGSSSAFLLPGTPSASDMHTGPASIGSIGGIGIGSSGGSVPEQPGWAYYFGIVQPAAQQQVEVAPPLLPQQAQQEQHQMSGARSGSGGVDGAMQGSASGSLQTSLSQAASDVIPSFYAMRPDVMEEVTLGALIGTGSMGRCYRGLWQGGRVAVKIIDCYVESGSLLDYSSPASPVNEATAISGSGGGGSSGGARSPTTSAVPGAEGTSEGTVAGAAAGTEAGTAGGAAGPEPEPKPESLSKQRQRQKEAFCAQAALVEALLARSLSHPHIVTTYCHGVSTGGSKQAAGAAGAGNGSPGQRHQQVWIVQEFCSRGSLLEAIDRGVLQLPAGGPNMPAILATAQEIAGALQYLHSMDVVHGDLTPSNVLLTSSSKDSRRWTCKVGDFGLAHMEAIKGEAGANQKRSGFGTVTHMAPELVVAAAGYASASATRAGDAYSFGVILLEMLLGKRAWLGSSFLQILTAVTSGVQPFSIPPDTPPPLASLLERCLHLDPSQRPTFSDILSEVQAMIRGLPRTNSPPGGTAGQGSQPAPAQKPTAATSAAPLPQAPPPAQGSLPGGSRPTLPALSTLPLAANPAAGTAPVAAGVVGASGFSTTGAVPSMHPLDDNKATRAHPLLHDSPFAQAAAQAAVQADA